MGKGRQESPTPTLPLTLKAIIPSQKRRPGQAQRERETVGTKGLEVPSPAGRVQGREGGVSLSPFFLPIAAPSPPLVRKGAGGGRGWQGISPAQARKDQENSISDGIQSQITTSVKGDRLPVLGGSLKEGKGLAEILTAGPGGPAGPSLPFNPPPPCSGREDA